MGIKTAVVVAGILAITQTTYAQATQPPGRAEQQPTRTEQQPGRTEQPSTRPDQLTVPQAQQPQQPPGPARAEQPRGSEQAQRREPPAEEKSSVTHHTARIAGQQIAYTATAATYVIRGDDGSPKASMFYVAYTRDGLDPSRRPISFVYNGGPGSASLFTHMGMGPRQVVLTADGHGMPAPYTIADNEDSFLDATDLVFIDAISTGYSRPAPGENPAQFHGIIADANWFADFIYRYINRNQRWLSPKFLIGESYGTTRSAELAGVLQERHEIYLSGIALVSSVAFANWGADDRTEFFLPTYTTSAWYHHLLAPDLQNLTLEQVADKARAFAHGEYAAALEKGDALSPEEHKKIVDDLARFTALSPSYIDQSNLRVSPFRWFRELLRSKRLTIGRLDSRFTGMEVDAAGERPNYDPSEASYEGAYVAAFHDYVRRELKWESDMHYTVTASVRPWDQTGNTEVAEVLRAAMTQQTYLKVLVVAGYYDLATPFNGIEQTVSHMHLEPPLRKNISFTYYEAGHMMYIDEKQHHKLHKDINEFISSSYRH